MEFRTPQPRRRRGRVVAAITAVALVLILAVAAWIVAGTNKTSHTASANSAQSEQAAPSASFGVSQYGTVQEMENATARDIKATYPEYFRCRAYPADDALSTHDLVPTANVNVLFTYNSAMQRYEVQSDSRIKVSSTTSTTTGDGGVVVPVQVLTFDFASTVRYYRTYVEMAQAGSKMWTSTQMMFAPSFHAGYQLSLPTDPDSSAQYPRYVVVGTDTTGCADGAITVPAGMWDSLAGRGLLQPEFYNSYAGHPQG